MDTLSDRISRPSKMSRHVLFFQNLKICPLLKKNPDSAKSLSLYISDKFFNCDIIFDVAFGEEKHAK